MILAGWPLPRRTPTSADLLAQLARTRDADSAARFDRLTREQRVEAAEDRAEQAAYDAARERAQ